jgi:hypothetical protein
MKMKTRELDGTIVVVDDEGGVWTPNDDAAAEIMATADPQSAAIEMCQSSPMRGRWQD